MPADQARPGGGGDCCRRWVLGGASVVGGDDLSVGPPADLRGQVGSGEGVTQCVHAAVEVITTCRGSTPSMVISAVGTAPNAAAVMSTSAGSGCAGVNSRISRRCVLTSRPAGKGCCRGIASRFSRCSVLTEDLPSAGTGMAANLGGLSMSNRRRNSSTWEAGRFLACRKAAEKASPGTAGLRRMRGAPPGLYRCRRATFLGRRALRNQHIHGCPSTIGAAVVRSRESP